MPRQFSPQPFFPHFFGMIPGSDRKLHLGVMAKYWEPGSVKTRLAASIGIRQAAELHRVFCHHLGVTLAAAADQRSFVIAPAARRADFEALLPEVWQTEVQCDGDLGTRMQTWFQAQSIADESIAAQAIGDRILVGADCPLLGGDAIRKARQRLADHDVVIGPAADGGYYLIGLRGPWRAAYECLFEQIPWSSETVFDHTRRRAAGAGLALATLPIMEDVDTSAELERLIEFLKAASGQSPRSLLHSILDVLDQRDES